MDQSKEREELLFRIHRLQDFLEDFSDDITGMTDQDIEFVVRKLEYKRDNMRMKEQKAKMMRQMLMIGAQIGEKLSSDKILPINLENKDGKSFSENYQDVLYPRTTDIQPWMSDEQKAKIAHAKAVDELIKKSAENAVGYKQKTGLDPNILLLMDMFAGMMSKHVNNTNPKPN